MLLTIMSTCSLRRHYCRRGSVRRPDPREVPAGQVRHLVPLPSDLPRAGGGRRLRPPARDAEHGAAPADRGGDVRSEPVGNLDLSHFSLAKHLG